ncbi:ankyrin repeat domain-containing protein 26 isoform X2 [Mixophyes fleayi]|uniref:ankyrin repeat domain-containing protein 26 isoform X2 n=1 Tax=Mixophyes fleayi TaxID=3061075 RepID=UPI003F4DB236
MKKIFSFGKKRKSGPSASVSETGSVLSVGYELKDKDLSKVHRAASSGDVAKIRQLLPKQDINQVDKENRTPLHLACAYGHLEAVKLLVENKAKLNLCDNDNRSPLIKAIQCQHENCSTILLEHEADPNLVDINGNAALHLAALIPSISIASQLLEHGAKVDAVNKEDCTPLILAVNENHEDMVEFLIKKGANVNSQDKLKRTSLIIAACNGHISIVKYLLQNNADINLQDYNGSTADDVAVLNGHHACSHLIIEHASRKKPASSPYYGAGKNKGGPKYSSPDRVVEGGFTLGSPALNKEGNDDLSQAESESRASGKDNSWASSDEDDLEFSPEKTSKPSLTQLLHTKKNVNEKCSFTTAQPRGFALQSKSDSEEDSIHDSEDEDVNIQSPPKLFPQARSFPHPVHHPGSFTNPSQLASASLLGINKGEFSSDDEADVGASHLVATDIAEPVKLHEEGAGRKVTLMSELGFEDDDVESPWDSESASESPRKQSSSDMPPSAVQAHMQCISEESNEDMYYSPSFLSPSRSYKMQDDGWLFKQREVSEKSTALKTDKNMFLQINDGSSANSLAKSIEKNNKPDLMADLGLDDIEDESDWDSTSHSLKHVSHVPKSVSQSHHKLNENTSSQTVSDNVASKQGSAASPPLPLHSVPEGEHEDHMNNENGLLNRIIPSQDNDDILNEHMLMTSNLPSNPELVNHVGNEKILQQQHENPLLAQNLENNQESSSDSEAPWEERYEKMWVTNEKKDVKIHFKDVTAELKKKFGEISKTNKKPVSKTIKSEKQECPLSLHAGDEHSAREKQTIASEEHQPVAEVQKSSHTVTFPFTVDKGNKSIEISDSSDWSSKTGNRSQEQNIYMPSNVENGADPFSLVEKEKHPSFKNNSSEFNFGASTLPKQSHLGNTFLLSEGLGEDLSNPSSGQLGDILLHAEKNVPSLKNGNETEQCKDVWQRQHILDFQNLQSHPDGKNVSQPFSNEVSNKILDKQLEQDRRRFKSEVGMLQLMFQNLSQERTQLQKESRKETNRSRQRELEEFKGSGDHNLEAKPNIQLITESKARLRKGKNDLFPSENIKSGLDFRAVVVQAGGKVHSKERSVNGDVHDAFDDSSLSETSKGDGGRLTGKHVDEKHKMRDDMSDFSHSSDTASEDYELPTSTFRNAMLLIEQLGHDGQDNLNSLKIQNIIHEYERVIEKEKGQRSLLSREVKKLHNERKEMQELMETNRELSSLLEQHKVDWESDLNNLRFTLKQEEDKRKSAEMLYDKSKEQLRKKEDQCCKEMEEKQHIELALRNLELEMRSLRNSLKQVEEERSETQRLYAQEHSARVHQETVLNNLRKRNEEEETKLLTKNVEVLSQPSETNEKVTTLTQRNITLQDEMNVLKQELEQVRSHCQEEETENDILKEKVEDLRKDLKMNEETLTQTVIQCNGQLNALKTETNMFCSKLEHEKQCKERLETELEAARSRLNSALQEHERSLAIKTETERTLQRERDEWLRSKDKLSHDLSNLRESNNNLSQQLSRAEAKSNGLENELHRTGLSLQERALLLDGTQRDLTQAQCKIKELEQTLQVEKDQINKSNVKQESVQERLAQITSENMQLRQQLEDVQNKGIIKEKAVSDVQDRFTDIFSKLRTDSERQVHMVEDRNKELINQSNELREQLYKLETEKVERESTIRQLQQELADALKKLSMSEASLEVITRYRNALEEEKQHLLKELEKFKSKLQDLEDQFIQSERRNHQLKNALDDKEREASAAFQKVQEFSSERASAEKTVKQLEEHVQKLEIENAKIEATAKQQMGQIEILQKELQESVSIRNRLEDLVTNLQSSKIGLEEKLNHQVHKQTTLNQSAQDSHNLWEEELKSRSRLGVRLAELEGSNASLIDQVGTEKKKVKKLVDLKKSVEERLDQEIKRNNELQRDVLGLKKLLKTAKKKLKEFEAGDGEQSNLKDSSRNSQREMDRDVFKLKEKVEELSSHLDRESRKHMQLESTNRDLHEQLSSIKNSQNNQERLERNKRSLEEEVDQLRRHIDSSKMDQSFMETYKREIEERGRQELRQKLEEVNLFLQAQSVSQDKLEQLRAENDASIRNQLEHRIEDLESELNRIKKMQQENINHKDSTQSELNRFKDLYTEEQKNRKSLTSKLERANERLAEANAKLLNERQRSKSIIASSFLNGSLTTSPVLDTSPLANLGTSQTLSRNLELGGSFLNTVRNDMAANRVESYIAKMQQELEKNITKELEQANAELDVGCTRISPVGSIAGSMRNLNTDQDPVSRAKQQYLEVLKKNHNI